MSLKASDITEVVAFGVQSEHCVLATSRGALDRGFKVTVLQGAHSTYDDPPKSAADIEREVEDQLSRKGAAITPWKDAVAAWEQRRMVSSYAIFEELS